MTSQNCLNLPLFAKTARSLVGLCGFLICAAALSFSQTGTQGDKLTLANESISATWSVRDGTVRWQSLINRLTSSTVMFQHRGFEHPCAGASHSPPATFPGADAGVGAAVAVPTGRHFGLHTNRWKQSGNSGIIIGSTTPQ